MSNSDIEVEIITGKNTSKIITEALLRLYKNNATKVLDNTPKKNIDTNICQSMD